MLSAPSTYCYCIRIELYRHSCGQPELQQSRRSAGMLDDRDPLPYRHAAHTAQAAKVAQQAAAAKHQHSSITAVAENYHLCTVYSSSIVYSSSGWVGSVARCIRADKRFVYINAHPATHRHDVEYLRPYFDQSTPTFYSAR